MQEENKKLSQEDLLKIVWKDLKNLLDNIHKIFVLLTCLYLAMVIFNFAVLVIIILFL